MKIAILTSPDQWFISYAKELNKKITSSDLYFNHEDMIESYDIVFILSYHKIIKEEYLQNNRHNIVVHASDLPKGKGWAPLFWQVLEDKNMIPFSMFEASIGVDNGDIYMQKNLTLTGYELNNELREKQAKHTIDMCLEFLNNYDTFKTPKQQNGAETFYKKRGSKDSELDINKTIKEQFNLLRIVDNENYPAFFELDGNRYILKIELDKMGGVTLIDFVDLSLEEKHMVLNWRNHNEIKKWMYSTHNIVLENHLTFIKNLVDKIDKQYIVVKKDDAYIGVIDFYDIDNSKKECEFGLYANLFEKIAGVGRILEEVCIKYAFDILKLNKLKLEVFEENEKAISLYKKYGFKQSGKKIINDKKVICMELKKS